MTGPTAHLLETLWLDGGWLSTIELAAECGIARNNALITLKRLESRGRIISRIVPIDNARHERRWRYDPAHGAP